MNPEEVDPFSSTPFTSPQATAFAGTDNHSSPTQQKESEPVADLLEGYGEQTPKNSTVFTHQQSPTSSAAITNRPVPLAISHDPLQNDDDLAPSTTAAAAAAALTGDGQLESSRNSSSSYLPPLAEKTTESATADANDATAATATDVDQLTDALKKQQKIRSSSSVNLKHVSFILPNNTCHTYKQPIVLDLPVPHSSFRITVGDPMTVGEGLKAHTEYNIISQVTDERFIVYAIYFTTNATISQSDLENLKGQEFSVRRRFKEFLWLYQQLSNKYPGVIVPPPPEKHALGTRSANVFYLIIIII
jgi:hypothetical protein